MLLLPLHTCVGTSRQTGANKTHNPSVCLGRYCPSCSVLAEWTSPRSHFTGLSCILITSDVPPSSLPSPGSFKATGTLYAASHLFLSPSLSVFFPPKQCFSLLTRAVMWGKAAHEAGKEELPLFFFLLTLTWSRWTPLRHVDFYITMAWKYMSQAHHGRCSEEHLLVTCRHRGVHTHSLCSSSTDSACSGNAGSDWEGCSSAGRCSASRVVPESLHRRRTWNTRWGAASESHAAR